MKVLSASLCLFSITNFNRTVVDETVHDSIKENLVFFPLVEKVEEWLNEIEMYSTKKRHHKNACWQQNRQGTVKPICFYIRPDYYYPIFIIKNWSLLPQFEPRDKMNILLTLVVYTVSYETFFLFLFFQSDLDLASFLRLLCLINIPIFQYS